jgi:hypothetical protein
VDQPLSIEVSSFEPAHGEDAGFGDGLPLLLNQMIGRAQGARDRRESWRYSSALRHVLEIAIEFDHAEVATSGRHCISRMLAQSMRCRGCR